MLMSLALRPFHTFYTDKMVENAEEDEKEDH